MSEASGGRKHFFSTPSSLLAEDWIHLIPSEDHLFNTEKEWAYWPEFSYSAGDIKSQVWRLSFLGGGSQYPCIESPVQRPPQTRSPPCSLRVLGCLSVLLSVVTVFGRENRESPPHTFLWALQLIDVSAKVWKLISENTSQMEEASFWVSLHQISPK